MIEKDTNQPIADTPEPQTDVEALEEAAKPEDISAYAEERQDQDAAEDRGEPVKKASRYERLKRARDAWKAEAEELKKRLGLDPEPPAETPPDNPYEEEIERGRREAEFAEQLAERDRQVAEITINRARAEQMAQHFPDFWETVRTAQELDIQVPPDLTKMLMKSPYGPALAYMLAKDALDPEGQGAIMHLQQMTPLEQAREFGKMEQAIINAERGSPAPAKMTSAPPPMRPVSGGSNAPKDLAALAAKDDISDYAKARRHA